MSTKSKTKVALSVAVACLCGFGLAAQLGFLDNRAAVVPSGAVVETEAQLPAAAVQPAIALSDAFVTIADAVTPSVVRIESRRRQSRRRMSIEDFFRGRETPPDELVTAGGSGFIVTEDGYVMTNNHVVEDAEEIIVILQDGRTFGAEIVGLDPTTDVAVIRIDGDNLQPVSLGSSAGVRVGEWVLAIGNPGFGTQSGGSGSLDYTVTAGIVSARGRSLDLIRRELQQDARDGSDVQPGFAIEDFIQTDAVINPGNSGGPMVNLRGQVVGINSAIASQTGFYVGYGFAIPIDLAHRIMEDLVAYGRVRRAYLGIRMESVRPEDAEQYGLREIAGALVQEVVENTPASEAGLAREDVIVAVDGDPVRTANDLQHKIALRAPGERVPISVYRDGREMEITVRLGEAPFSEDVAEEPVVRSSTASKLGIEVAEITPEIAEEYGLDSTEGVIVGSVQEGGPAYRRNIGRGCVIHEINREQVRTLQDVTEALDDVEAGDVVSLVAQCPLAGTNVYNLRVSR